MATRKDVALLAGVSSATVSHYVSGKKYVSKETSVRVAAAIKELNYRPNLIAKSLKSKDTKQLVFICNEIRNPFHAQVAYDATNTAYEQGYTTLFCNVIDDVEYINRLCGYQVNGFFIATSKISAEAINSIVEKNIPVVLMTDKLEENMDERVSKIVIDYSASVCHLVEHLKGKGASTFCYISATSLFEDGKTKAVRDAMQSYGINACTMIGDIASAQDAYWNVMKRFQDSGEFPQAFICTNDAVASGTLRAAYDLGYRCPEQVLITGIDNTISSSISIPSITTIDNRNEEISRRAIDMLLKKCKGDVVEDYIVETRVCYRESTDR